MNTQTLNRLWGMRCYLIGAMDRAPDNGVEWREKVTPFLAAMGVVVLNPCNKPIDIGLEGIEDRTRRRRLKEEELYDQLSSEIKLLRVVDLRMVDMSDFLIVNIDTDVHACGTYEEDSWANRMKNPIMVHCEQGKQGCPDWMFGKIPHEHIFTHWSDMMQYLWNIHTGLDNETFKRWLFFKYQEMMPKVTIEESRDRDAVWSNMWEKTA